MQLFVERFKTLPNDLKLFGNDRLKFMISIAKKLNDAGAILYGSFVRDWIVPKINANEDVFTYNNENFYIRDLNIRFAGSSCQISSIINSEVSEVCQMSPQTQQLQISDSDYNIFTMTITYGVSPQTYSKRRDFDVNTLIYHNN